MCCNLNPSQNYSGAQFVLTSDGSGGTDVTARPISVTVSSGQTLTVSSGQTSGGVLVLSGGTLNILSGGTASGITVSKAAPTACRAGTSAPRSMAGWRSSAAAGLPAARPSSAAARRPISA